MFQHFVHKDVCDFGSDNSYLFFPIFSGADILLKVQRKVYKLGHKTHLKEKMSQAKDEAKATG